MDIVKAVEEFAKENLDPYAWQHTLRVRRLALEIYKVEGGNKEIIEVASLLHDIGYIKGFKNHVKNGGHIARSFLTTLGVEKGKTEKIVKSVVRHSKDPPPETIEEKIVNDADALERVGALGIHRMGISAIKNFHLPPHEALSFTKEVTSLSYQNLKTETAKRIAQPVIELQKEFFKQIETQMKS
jgi:uncharacterized protein